MKLRKLLEVTLAKAERGLWFDHDERGYDPRGWGICIKLFSGPVLRPMTRPRYWFSRDWVPSKWNSFDPEYHWLLKWPMPVAPFVSIALGPWGVYFGFKVWDSSNPKYRAMTPEVREWLAPSISTRSTRWK